jgi:hypothetical protein
MMAPTVTETRRNGNPVGERVELGRYRIPAGERIVYGQRVDGVVRSLVARPVVFVVSTCRDEDSRCRPRKAPPEAANDDGERRAAVGFHSSADRPRFASAGSARSTTIGRGRERSHD